MSTFLSAQYRGIAEYVPGEQPKDRRYVKLNTNESPFPPCPGALEALAAYSAGDLRLYSDPESDRLRAAIAARYGLSPDMVLPTNGSDEALSLCCMAYAGAPMRFPDVTYGLYKVLCGLYGIQYTEMPVRADFSVDIGDYLACGQTVVLANPNAPTGLSLPRSDIERILQSNPRNIVVIDEAYVDFGGESCVPLIAKYPNLIVVMTCSKSRSLAGARLGFAMAQKPLIDDLRLLKNCANPYNISSLTQLLGEKAMEDETYFNACVAGIVNTREETRRALSNMGFVTLDCRTNFLFVKPPMDCEAYCAALRARGVLVRHFSGARVRDFARVTVGSSGDMRAYLEATQAILKEQTQ